MKKILLLHKINEQDEYNAFARDFVTHLNHIAEDKGLDVRAEEKGFTLSTGDSFKHDFKYKNPFTYFELGQPCGYDLILDRASYAFDFLKVFIENAMSTGTFVINNPIDKNNNKIFEYTLAHEIGMKVPRTAVPLNARYGKVVIDDHNRATLDIDLKNCLQAVGGNWPVYLKGGYAGEHHAIFKCDNMAQFYNMYKRMPGLMIIQECIDYDKFVKCFVIGEQVIIVKYCPETDTYFEVDDHLSPEDGMKLWNYARAVSVAPGYTINTAEFARHKQSKEWYVIDCTDGACFDMRPEVLKKYYWVVMEALVELCINYVKNPRHIESRVCISHAKDML